MLAVELLFLSGKMKARHAVGDRPGEAACNM